MHIKHHLQFVDIAVIILAFAASIYWVTESKERKLRRKRKIRQLLRLWVTIKKQLKPIAPALRVIETAVRFLVPWLIFAAVLPMLPFFLLGMGFSKLSQRSRQLPIFGNVLGTFFSWITLGLLFLAVITTGALFLIFLAAQFSSESRQRIEFTVAFLGLLGITFNLLAFAPLKLINAFLHLGLGWGVSKILSHVMTYLALGYAWVELLRHVPGH